MEGPRRQGRDVIEGVVDAPGVAGPVADQGGGQAGRQGDVLDAADRQHLQGEHRAGDRRAEHGAEAGRDARHEHDPHVRRAEPEHPADAAGQAAAQLDGSPFTPGRTAKQMGDHRRDQDQGRHPQRRPGAGFMDLLYDQVIAAFRRPPLPMVEQADRRARQGQAEQQPGILEPQTGGLVERPQEQGAGAADGRRHGRDEHRPAGHGGKARDHGQRRERAEAAQRLKHRHDSTVSQGCDW